MEKPRIQYVTSSDGTEIAYAVIGSGPPLVLVDSFLSGGLDLRLGARSSAEYYNALAEGRTLISLDWRGSGLSGPTEEFSFERFVGDVESVVDHLKLDRFDLCGLATASKVGLEFAALHPERVRKLTLLRPNPKGFSPRTSELAMGIGHLASLHWEAFTAVFALRQQGWTEDGREVMEQIRKKWTPATFEACMTAVEAFDPLLRAASIRCPTLVLASEDDPELLRRTAQRLAALIPSGHLVVSRGGTRNPDHAKIVQAFLGDWDEPAKQIERPAPVEAPPVRTILFTDIEAHTQMMQRLGDAKGRDLLREHERLTREALAAHGGTEVKTMGDGFMASFGSRRRRSTAPWRSSGRSQGSSRRRSFDKLRMP